MNVKYTLRVGKDEFELNVDVKNEKELFEKLSFYSNLPRTAPKGADDLKLVFRTTKKGHKYYSLISETEQMEFRLGQNLEANGGGLFPKGWQPVYQGDDAEEGQQAAAPAFGSQQAAPQAQTQAAPAFGQTQAAPAQQAAPAAAPQFGMPAPQAFAPPAQQAAPAPAPAAAAPAAPANPQVAAVANNVLARFGINKQ